MTAGLTTRNETKSQRTAKLPFGFGLILSATGLQAEERALNPGYEKLDRDESAGWTSFGVSLSGKVSGACERVDSKSGRVHCNGAKGRR